jgi:TonB family protein
MAIGQVTHKPRHDGTSSPRGELARFLNDPAKVGFVALVLTSLAMLEGWLLWNKLRARAPADSVAQAFPVRGPASVTAPVSGPAPESKPVALPTQPTLPDVAAEYKPVAPAKPVPPSVVREPAADSKTSTQASMPSAPPSTASKPAKEEKRPNTRKAADASVEPRRLPRKTEPATKPIEAPATQTVQPVPSPAPTPAPRSPTLQQAAKTLEPISRAPFEFPLAAARQGISEGRVKARATIGPGGNVLAVEIVSAYPQRLFDRAVMESITRWKFPPGADRRSYEVEVEFKR